VPARSASVSVFRNAITSSISSLAVPSLRYLQTAPPFSKHYQDEDHWDHFPVPQGDLLGPGSRVPAIIVSPFAKHGSVDHTPYDTGSILRLITRRFELDTLPGLTDRNEALVAHGAEPMGDLTNALDLLP
jgi:acid phosphatase